MKYFGALLIAALFLALPMTSAWHYGSYHPHQPYHHGYYDGADIVFRGEVTRIQRLGGSDPRVEVTLRVRDRIRGNPSSTVVLTFPRYRDGWGQWHDDVPLVERREYVIGARRSDNRHRLVWYEPVSHYRPPTYTPPYYPPYQPPVQVTPITIPNPQQTNTCSVLESTGQIILICPSTQTVRLQPLSIGTPQSSAPTTPRVPIAAFPWLH